MNQVVANYAVIVILGAGGHGRVVADVARANHFTDLLFCDPGQPAGSLVDGVKISSQSQDDLIQEAITRAVGHSPKPINFLVAVGSTPIRRRLVQMLADRNAPTISLTHPSAVISPSASIGRGVVIMPNSVINARARIGDWAIVNTGAIVEHDATIGMGSHIAPASTLTGGVRVGEWCDIGAGATILPQVAIGDGACIGAGAVVLSDAAPGRVYAGVPAKQLTRS